MSSGRWADPTDDDRAPAQSGGHRVRFALTAALLGLYFVFAFVAAAGTHHRIGLGGAPLFYDFSALYQAGSFADAGHAPAAYDDNVMIAAERAAFPGTTARLPWNYPPTFQLVFMPLAALPYALAWGVWSGAVYGLYALLAGRLVGRGNLWLLLLAPAAAVNLFVGQNGLLSAVLMGGGVLMLRSRPIVGGVLLGMMAYKPQLAVLAPLALCAGREWRALAAAVVSEVVFTGLSVAVLGVGPWLAFVHFKLVQPAAIFTSSSSDWRAIPSVLIMVRTFGLGDRISAICHWSSAAVAAAAALWVWWSSADGRLRAGALAGAAVLVTPYLRPYDLALLILPIAVLLPSAGGARGVAENVAVFAAWMVPAVLTFAAPPVQLAPVASAAMLALVVWRAARPPSAHAGGASSVGTMATG